MSKRYSVKSIGIGAVSGIIAGAIMMVPMMAFNVQMGMPADLFPTLIGRLMGQGIETVASTGIAMHILTSIIIGIIFGAVTSIPKLRLNNIGKGVGLGVATGIITTIVLFLPMMMTVLPPQMIALMQMMNPDAPSSMIMEQIQTMMPMMIGSSIIAHIIYGVVLGSIATVLIMKSSGYECKECHMRFNAQEEFDEHKEQHH